MEPPMATSEQITECLKMLKSAFAPTLRNSTIPAEADAMYTLMLQSTPGDVLQAASLKVIATDTWYPTIARLLEACRDVQLAAQPGHDWELGWRICVQAANKFGCIVLDKTDRPAQAFAYIRERDAVAEEVVKRLGWADFCHHEDSEQTTWKAQFRNAYQVIVNREQAALALPQHVSAQIMQVSAALSAQWRIAAPKN